MFTEQQIQQLEKLDLKPVQRQQINLATPRPKIEKPLRKPRSRRKGGYPDLHLHVPKTQVISGAYHATPYVQEKRESSGEYQGPRRMRQTDLINRRYSIHANS